MDQAIKAEWVRRLRSGKLFQGAGLLRQPDKHRLVDRHCCLGVLMDMAVEAGVVNRDKGSDAYLYFDSASSHLTRGGLTPAAMQWAGLDSAERGALVNIEPRTIGPTNHGLYDADTLAHLNDAMLDGEHVFPFSAIADVIEEEL